MRTVNSCWHPQSSEAQRALQDRLEEQRRQQTASINSHKIIIIKAKQQTQTPR